MIAREASTTQRWSTSEWLAEVTEWVTDALRVHGVQVTGPLERLNQRPWSVVVSVPTSQGVFYAKQNCPGQNFEARLVGVLAALVPDHVVAPVSVDIDRGFLLTPDGGPLLSSVAESDVNLWCQVVAQWAEVQRALILHANVLGDLGVTPLPTAALPGLVASRAEQLRALGEGDPRAIDEVAYAAVCSAMPMLTAAADRLAGVGLPLTLNHNDLHEHNVFAPRGENRLRFFDFGDSVLADPLMALRIPVNVVGHDFGVDDDHPIIRRIIDAFLEVWSDLASMRQLRSVVPDALRLGRICRHESWWRVLPCLDDSELSEYGDAAAFWLSSLTWDRG